VLEDPRQVRLLLLRRRDHEEMLDLLRAVLPLGERDELGIAEECSGQRADALGDGRREETGLPLHRQVLADLAHVGPEAQREQLVRLVDHQGLHPVEAQSSGAQVIQNPARGAHHHVGPGLDALDLLGVADPAVDGHAADALVPAQRGELSRDLVGELAGRRHHQGLAVLRLGVECGRNRDSEGAGLPASGLRLNDQVAAFPHQRQDLLLNRHGLGPAQVADALRDDVREVGEDFGEGGHGGNESYHAGSRRASRCLLLSGRAAHYPR
jgi:hypothetical protein